MTRHLANCKTAGIRGELNRRVREFEIEPAEWIDLMEEVIDLCSCTADSHFPRSEPMDTIPERSPRNTPHTLLENGWEGFKPTDHEDTKCHWKKTGPNRWVCEHNVISQGHPRGWCDQGCCR